MHDPVCDRNQSPRCEKEREASETARIGWSDHCSVIWKNMDPIELKMHQDLRQAYGHIEEAITQGQEAHKKAGKDQFRLIAIEQIIKELKATSEPLIRIVFQN